MSDNRTALTLQQCKDEIAMKHGLHNWDNACYVWAGFVKQMEPFMDEVAELYASQQTASLREENERLKREKESPYYDGFAAGNQLNQQQVKQLQEEVKRLRDVLKESKDTILYLVSEYANGTSMAAEETLTLINRTLSSKESKPS